MELDDGPNDVLLGDGTEERTPRDLVTPAVVMCVAFHPTAPVIAVGMVDGGLEVHEFRRNETRPISNLKQHKSGGIAAMEFTRGGGHLATISSDKHIKVLDCQSQQTVIDITPKRNPHKDGLSSLCVCTSTMLAVGDDDGRVSIWDMRQQKPVHQFFEHADQVTGIIYFEANSQLVTCSADTTLGCFDIRAKPLLKFSEKRRNEELNCMTFLPATNNIVCGTDSGTLPIWRYGSWARPYDVHGKHPKECQTMMTYNDNIFLTGAYDGLVRVIQHNPVRRVLTNLGGHFKDYNTLTTMSISHDRTLLACAGNDRLVKFHDIEFLGSEDELDKLRGKAERLHMQTIRNAVAEDAALAAEAEAEEHADSDTSADSEAGGGHDEEVAAPSSRPMQIGDTPLDRATKRERMAASRWLKTAQKEQINFLADKRRKRTKGFWKDLVD